MDGQAKTLFWFSEEKIEIEVPFFQRPYVWNNDPKNDNWRNLIDNIANSPSGTMPFIGSFILKAEDNLIGEKNVNNDANQLKKYWVIDGQQRITTISILIRCFLDICGDSINHRTITKLEDFIYKTIQTDHGEELFYRRVTPSNADKEAFEIVMSTNPEDKKDLKAGKSKIIDCYLYFKEYLSKLTKDEVVNFSMKLTTNEKFFVEITLGSKDDEQVIFDTVNSLGKKLTNSDIVKNYLYQRMKNLCGDNKVQLQNVLDHYAKYWEKVFLEDDKRDFWDEEVSLGRITTTNLDAFLKDFGTIKGIYVPSESGGIDGLTQKYKETIDKLNQEELFEFSKELSEYGTTYFDIWNEYEECKDFRMSEPLNVTLLILDQLETSTFNPYILKLVKEKDPKLNEKLEGLQKFILKRFLWKASKKNYNNCCLVALKVESPNQYFDEYNDNSEGVDWLGYPTQVKSVTNRQGALLLFLIEMIRRFNNGESNYPDPLVFNRKLDSLEHIMPKKWKEHWYVVPSFKVDDKGGYIEVAEEEKEGNRKSKIQSLGNMTLLTVGLNSKISNSDFKVKIEGNSKYKGYRQFVGSISVAKEIVDRYDESPKWDERDIIERELSLANELNNFYHFGGEIKQDLEEKSTIDFESIGLEYFTDEYFENQKVQVIAKEGIAFLFIHHLIDSDEIELLKTQPYSSKNFGVWLPLLESDPNKLRRYYKEPIVNGSELHLCKEWYKKDRDRLVGWLKPRLERKKS